MEIKTYSAGEVRMVKFVGSKTKALILSKKFGIVRGYDIPEGEYTVIDQDGKMCLKTEDELEFISEEEEREELKIFLMELLLDKCQ